MTLGTNKTLPGLLPSIRKTVCWLQRMQKAIKIAHKKSSSTTKVSSKGGIMTQQPSTNLCRWETMRSCWWENTTSGQGPSGPIKASGHYIAVDVLEGNTWKIRMSESAVCT